MHGAEMQERDKGAVRQREKRDRETENERGKKEKQ